ncbi:MAG: OmpA family protein, partial [Bradymonadaceae bacterium]
IAELEKKVKELENKKAELSKKLQTAEDTLQMYEQKKGSLNEKLGATREELSKLREQQREQKKRLQKYRDLAKKLAETFKSEQLSVKVRDGKMVIEMSDDVLFDSGQAQVNDSGKKVLQQLANVLKDMKDREFLVAGHTDNVPISSSKFEDNWDLSASRASNVVRFLSDKGVDPGNLAAAGFSKFDPIATNKTEEGKAKNRRIEIILMPKVEELPSLPKDLFESDKG